ncbi:VOC family protein [Lentzea sp. BCCO 10_0061]|uniref:VOC family protein n=1 Tax=Lentzea sokolovensis TaxID=3095429 RepID=A0ABU4V4R9_9PSEU|nr:VOC family protein [Lentzea sp. BCCO 10_0061]MDX8145951.1 VOC family protein [Lentzea sp. BCCO 10_0061]
MANEVTIPLLPCASIDEVAEFYVMLGFTVTYRQYRPNAYLSVRRSEINLHFFGIPGYEPAESYSSCLIQVEDPRELYEAFAHGMRAVYGQVLLTGIPRMTRPRRDGFLVVDPGGNWIRVVPAVRERESTRNGLTRALTNAVTLAGSHGAERQALRILEGALAREVHASEEERASALEFREELLERLNLHR